MKIVKLLIFLVLISLQAGATGYSHNMFVAHKKLQAGKESKALTEQSLSKKSITSKVSSNAKQVPSEASFTKKFANKLSGVVTLNQRVIEEGPASLFETGEEKESDGSIVTKLATAVKGMVYAFIGSSAFSKS